MKIELTEAYKVGDKTFATVAQAEVAALVSLGLPENVAAVIVSKADEVIEILSTPVSKSDKKLRKPRKPRSDIGKKREAAPSTPATDAA